MTARCGEVLSVELQLCGSREAAVPEGGRMSVSHRHSAAVVAAADGPPHRRSRRTARAHRNGRWRWAQRCEERVIRSRFGCILSC